MWYRVEMGAWVAGIVLQSVLISIMVRNRGAFRSPWLFLWLVFDGLFSAVLYVVNHFGGPNAAYPAIWDFLQPIDVALMGYAATEAVRMTAGRAALMVTCTMAVGLMLDDRRHILTMSAFVCFIVSAGLAMHHRGPVLGVYSGAMAVQHMSVLWHEQRWHAGAFAEVISVVCFAAWICNFRRVADADRVGREIPLDL